MTCREAAELGKAQGFPLYSATAHCLANRPELSGVQRVPALQKVFGEKRRKKPNRRNPYSLTVRLDETALTAFNREREAAGHTIQDALERAVTLYVYASKLKRNPASAGTEQGARKGE